uniref:ATP synthase complex subunit 8 n=1 Tax=Erythrocebus patas TaxID=9538 RepID=S4UUE1_ERYPA|nr:ATP synthase subunit 8 [Erythrocebus patas]AGM47467.1 ATP synthase subunit 8 [Erythrocebus patas]
MPQLDTSTWFTTIMTTLFTLYIMMQLKLLNTNYYQTPLQKNSNKQTLNNPWQLKWTKIYLPHSRPQ